MTKCYQNSRQFPPVKRRKVEADFSGGAITGNGGIVLLSQVDQQLGLSCAVARAIGDARRKASCNHALRELLRQRIYGLALGYEDLNDHEELRYDLALQTACPQPRHARGALRSSLTLAKCLCGTAHRVNTARVPQACHRIR